MKPISLEFCGINSFSEPASIDFTDLLEFGIFGIFGDTGSGKSTILDCIVFALYGRIGRVNGRDNSLEDVINFRRDRAYVRFEFETAHGGERHIYRIERNIRLRKGANGGCEHTATLYERKGGALVTVAEGAENCKEPILSIVGLKQEDFEKCIALPQGEFAQFVKSSKADRLRIVARLFDLERFGASLGTRANRYASAAAYEANVVKTRLEPYADVDEAGNAALRTQIAELESRDGALKKDLDRAREEEKRLSLLIEKNREKRELSARFEKLEAAKDGMKKLADELDRLDRANAAVRAERERAGKERELRAAEEELRRASDEEQTARKTFDGLPPFDAEKSNAEITRLNSERGRAAAADGIRRRLGEMTAEEKTLREQLLAVQKDIVPLDYTAERDSLLEKQKELGSEDFLGFLETHGRSALLRGEYAAFADELERLEEKYPAIKPDTAPSVARYRALSEGEKADFSDLKRVFEQRERARDAAAKALSELDKVKYEQDLLNGKAADLTARIRAISTDIETLQKDLGDVPQIKDIDEALRRLQSERDSAEKTRRDAREALSSAEQRSAIAAVKAEGARGAYAEAEARLRSELEGVFSTAEEAASLVSRYGDAAKAKERVGAYREEYSHVRKQLRALEETEPVSEEAVAANKGEIVRLSSESEETTKSLAVARRALAEGEQKLLEKGKLTEELARKQAEADLADKLKKLLGDNRFIEFVAEEYLQTVAINASARLLSLTNGRYFLRYDGSFFVGDNFNGGKSRGVNTLSGGETFLVSLSLALALSTEICRKSLRPIEFFFLDEGFGTLDGHLVDVVMDSLEKLKGEHFSIGLISHVEELKHRIERKLLVEKATETSGSKIKTE